MQWKDESRDELPNLSCSIFRSAPFGLFPFALGNNGSSTFYCSSVSFMPDYHRLTHLTIAGVLF